MKKILAALFLITGIAMGAFAQFRVSFIADLNPELVRYGTPTGDSANQESGSFQGLLDILSSSSNDLLGKENELLLRLRYNGKGFAVNFQSNFDSLVKYYNDDDEDNKAIIFPSFVNGEGTPPILETLLAAIFDEWWIRGSAGFISGYVGNGNDRGKVDRLQNFDEYLPTLIKSYGVNTPDPRDQRSTYLNFQDGDNNNFRRQQRTEGRYYYRDQPYFCISMNFADLIGLPLSAQIVGDVGYNAGLVEQDTNGDDIVVSNNYYKMNGGIRISGEEIANLITFDAIYKFRGGGPNTQQNEYEEQPAGRGVITHSFGLYANLLNLAEGLGIGLGYTGLVRAYEDRDLSDFSPGLSWETRQGPFFSGIDLRLEYTVKKFTFASNNNVSFGKTGVDSTELLIQAMSFRGRDLPSGTKENWLALYNTLGVNYELSKKLNTALQIGNNMGIYTKTVNANQDVITRNMLSATCFVIYEFNKNITFQSGLQFLYDSFFKKDYAGDTSDGMIYLALPVRLRISF